MARASRPADGATTQADDALDTAESFLGSSYDEVAPGVFRSVDGTRQVRMAPRDLAPGPSHAGGRLDFHFEEGRVFVTPSGRESFRPTPGGNSHVFLDPTGL